MTLQLHRHRAGQGLRHPARAGVTNGKQLVFPSHLSQPQAVRRRNRPGWRLHLNFGGLSKGGPRRTRPPPDNVGGAAPFMPASVRLGRSPSGWRKASAPAKPNLTAAAETVRRPCGRQRRRGSDRPRSSWILRERQRPPWRRSGAVAPGSWPQSHGVTFDTRSRRSWRMSPLARLARCANCVHRPTFPAASFSFGRSLAPMTELLKQSDK